MTDQPPSEPAAPPVEPAPALDAEPAAPPAELAPAPATEPGSSPVDAFTSLFPEDRPEIAVGAAFGGGLLVALILKRLAR